MLRSTLNTLKNNISKKQFHTSSCVCHGGLTVTTDKDGVREIVFNDAKRRHALSMEMMDDLLAELSRDWDDKKLRCIVVTSSGAVFSSGHNLKELVPENGYESHRQVFAKCSEIMKAIRCAPVPVIAKVDGLAAAGGCQLVASCDIVISSDRSSFSTPGASFGIFCSTPGIAVARAIPRSKALYMLYTGLPITAQEAYIAGLVSVLVPHEKLDEEVEKVCNAIKSKSRAVIQLGKEFYQKQITMSVDEAFKSGETIMADNLALPDGQEGIRSFVEKRKPKWE